MFFTASVEVEARRITCITFREFEALFKLVKGKNYILYLINGSLFTFIKALFRKMYTINQSTLSFNPVTTCFWTSLCHNQCQQH